MISFRKLFVLLAEKELSKTDFRIEAGISSDTLAKLGKGGIIKTTTINKICETLGCQPGDIMEWKEKNEPSPSID